VQKWHLRSGDLARTLAYFFGKQNFSTTNISHTFCRSATKFGSVGGRHLFPTFRELRSGRPMIPGGKMPLSFTDNTYKVVFSVLSIH